MTVEIESLPLPLPAFIQRRRDRRGVRPRTVPRAAVVVDGAAGRLTWHDGRGHTRSAPLPGHGPDAVEEVVRLSYTQRNTRTGSQYLSRLLFVGGGRVLWGGRTLPSQVFDRMWPGELWAALSGTGVTSRAVDADDARDADRLVPGAAPLLGAHRAPAQVLEGLLLAAVLFAVVALVLALL